MLHTILSGRTRFLTHLIGWIMLALLIFSLVSGLRSYEETLARTLLNMVFLVGLFYLNARWLINRFFETGRYGLFVGQVLVLWLGLAVLRVYAEKTLFGGSILPDDQFPIVSDARMFAAFALSFFILLLFSSLYQLLENRLALELRNRELEVRHTEAQLNYLKAQINPHFLFNTLNNIYAAATLQHPHTGDMILRLSDLLRYVTYDGKEPRVSLEKELAQIRAYLELFQLKSESPLSIRMERNTNGPEWQIEPVLLLPLVENALKHGNLEQAADAYLNIRVQTDADQLDFLVENTFDPEDRQKDGIGGVGLENIRQRLQLLYPKRHHFRAQASSGIFTARLILHINPETS
ncbi:MAG: hypothetical protein EP344_09725 [Bacteroidetes bacterium]|nr:MAG: hypothetical protein EP344_09725 [Bacteroidota bacterium]